MNFPERRVAPPSQQQTAAAEADRRQAEYFRDELLRMADDLDTQIATLKNTLARQTGHRELGFHVTRTRSDLRAAVAERDQISRMLAALGQPWPAERVTPS